MCWYRNIVNKLLLSIAVLIVILAIVFKADIVKWIIVAVVLIILGNIVEYLKKPKVQVKIQQRKTKAVKKKRR